MILSNKLLGAHRSCKLNFAHRNEIIIALIGLLGVIFTAVISNYDKLSDGNPKTKNKFPYENVEDVDLQMRYFIEVSGLRDGLNEMNRIAAEKYRLKYGATEEEINCILDNRIQNEQVIELFIGAHKNHISLRQIKELNRLHSSEIMKSYNKASPLIVRDLLAGIDKLYERIHIRNQSIVGASKNQDAQSCPVI